MALAVLVRSVPVALADRDRLGGPARAPAAGRLGSRRRFFPGLLLEAFVAGGTSAVSATRALLTVAVYVAVAAAVAGTIFARRDVTA